MARLAVFHDSNPGGGTAVIATRNNADAPWGTDVTDYGKLLFDSRNPDQLDILDLNKLIFATFDTSGTGEKYWPAGANVNTATHTGERFSGGGDATLEVYEMTGNTLGIDYPNIAICKKFDADGWLLGNFCSANTDDASGGGVVREDGTIDSYASIFQAFLAEVEDASYPAYDDGYTDYLVGTRFAWSEQNIYIDTVMNNDLPDLIVHLNLPADDTAVPFLSETPTPGQTVARLANTGVKIVRPGFDVDTASADELLIDSDKAPLRVIAAGEVTVEAGTTETIPLPSGISYGENIFLDYIAWNDGYGIIHPTYFQSAAAFNGQTQGLRSKIVSGDLLLNNPGSGDLEARYIVFGTDDNPVSSGSTKLVGVYNDGSEDYIQIRRPGSDEPPTLQDILLDTRFPYCPIIAEGWVSIPDDEPFEEVVSFSNDGSFKPYPIFAVRINRNTDNSKFFEGGCVKRIVQFDQSQGGSFGWAGQLTGDSCYAEITDTSVTFKAFPENPSSVQYLTSGGWTDRYIRTIDGLRYYVLALPIS